MTNLYACRFDLETGNFEKYHSVQESYPNFESEEEAIENGYGGAGYATFEENSIYAESIVSQEDADRLVIQKCKEMIEQLSIATGDVIKLR